MTSVLDKSRSSALKSSDDTVMFLGAGASVPFNIPITNRLFPMILERLADKSLFRMSDCSPTQGITMASLPENKRHIEHFTAVIDSRDASKLMTLLDARLKILFPGLERSTKQLPAITDVLSFIDYLISGGVAPSPRFTPTYLLELRELLERAVLEVLQSSLDAKLEEYQRKQLDQLVDWMLNTRRESANPLTIISTNYDTLFENQIYARLRQEKKEIAASIDYGFNWRDTEDGTVHLRPLSPTLRIYKLHGSLNWLQCELCGHIYMNPDFNIATLGAPRQLNEANICHCLHGPLRTVIVAPSVVRNIRDPNLLSIWQAAIESLRKAQTWNIIGYSLPGEDLAIRSILSRAERGHVNEPQVSVYQRSPELEERFRLMFPNCRYSSNGLEEFLSEITHT